jgi:DNA-binding beta-propeller fold protein YncE
MNANLVLGQSVFTSSQGQAITTANSLYYPYDARFDPTGNLWVADCGNDRVLRYAQPFSNGMAANLVLGQPGVTTRLPPAVPDARDAGPSMAIFRLLSRPLAV